MQSEKRKFSKIKFRKMLKTKIWKETFIKIISTENMHSALWLCKPGGIEGKALENKLFE